MMESTPGTTNHKSLWYEWDLLEDPPERFSCGVCFQLMQRPQLPTCCGQQNLCITCVTKIREVAERSARWRESDDIKKPACPFCREEGFQTTVSADLESSILSLSIRCPHSKEGCAWKGMICEAQSDHLILHCNYHPVGCPNNCSAMIRRCEMAKHIEVCPNQAVPCPFQPAGCSSQRIKRKDLTTHTKHNIHEHLLQSSVKISQVSRKYMALSETLESPSRTEQLRQTKQKKTSLRHQISKIQETNSALEKGLHTIQQEIDALKEEMEKSNVVFAAELKAKDDEIQGLREFEVTLRETIAAIPDSLGSPIRTPPVTFTLNNFEERKAHNEDWVSPPFYSHVGGGYKMFLSVNPNGHGDGLGTHVSIFVHFMPGEYDDSLQWPFEGRITIVLENQQNILAKLFLQPRWDNHAQIVCLDSIKSLPNRCRVPATKAYGSGRGQQTFIPHGELGPFLSEDTLKITVLPILFLPL